MTMDDFDKAVEKEVEDVREYLENIIALMPGHIFWKDLNCRFLGCNDAQAKIAGLSSRHEIIGKSSVDVISKNQPEHLRRQQAEAIDKVDRRIMRTGIPETVEEPLIAEDGTEQVFLSQKVVLRDKNGNIIGLLGVSVDVTDKKAAEELRAKQAVMEAAAQVSHDIRSPLAALNAVLRKLDGIPEDQRVLVRNAVRRINDIANNLLAEYRVDADETHQTLHSQELLSSLLDVLMSEKKAQLDSQRVELNLNIEPDAFGLFVEINSVQFKRVISNLMNNSIEAIEGRGEVTLHLSKNDRKACITLVDTGKGMPTHVLEKIKYGGTSHDKKEGTGIGIASAIELVKDYHGEFDIASQAGQGTTVVISLPISPTPSWFQDRLALPEGSTLVVLDDDESVHAIWKSRLQPFLTQVKLKHFHHSKAFREYYATTDLSNAIFLIDYELLGSNETGLDIIESLGLGRCAILVTSRYEEPSVREKATKLGVKIVPKNYSPYIDISLVEAERLRLVFIDDSEDLTNAWEMAANLEGIHIKTFNTIDDLRNALPSIPETTPIYIDSSLNDEIRGEIFAKELYEKGYKELYLASGYPREYFGDLPWIKAFVGKEPAFYTDKY